jgi:hypothetical protein
VALGQREERRSIAGECRQCHAFCDKLVDPAGCIEMGCGFLYTYDDPLSGRRYMGCVNKVFKGEIDVEAFNAAERSGGFGGIKMTGEPLPQCRFRVERAYEGEGPEFECTNRRFFDCADTGPDAVRVFDLRNVLT